MDLLIGTDFVYAFGNILTASDTLKNLLQRGTDLFVFAFARLLQFHLSIVGISLPFKLLIFHHVIAWDGSINYDNYGLLASMFRSH